MEKAIGFAVRIVNLHKDLIWSQEKGVISKQVVRRGMRIGANISVANHAQRKADFDSKLYVSLKEAEYISKDMEDKMLKDCGGTRRMLIASIKTAICNGI